MLRRLVRGAVRAACWLAWVACVVTVERALLGAAAPGLSGLVVVIQWGARHPEQFG